MAMTRITRRSFSVGIASSTAPLGFLFPHVYAQAQAQSAASSIAMKVAGGFAEKVGGEAAGQALGYLGLGGDAAMAEMNLKLDQILNELRDLKRDIENFRLAMEKALYQVSYDTAAAQITPLVAINETILQYYQAMNGADDASLKGAQAGILKQSALLATAPATWHNAMMGASGQTGLIAAWNRAATAKSPFFGPVELAGSAPLSIQRQWAYLDAHQALSINFLWNLAVSKKQFSNADQVREEWLTNRLAQMRLVHGGSSSAEPAYRKTDGGQWQSSTFEFTSALPPRVILNKAYGQEKWLMWFTDVGPTYRYATWDQSQAQRVLDERSKQAVDATKVGLNGEWQLATWEQYRGLVESAGARVGDHVQPFVGILDKADFHVWKAPPVIGFLRPATIVYARDGDNWVEQMFAMLPVLGPVECHQLLCREVPASELALYLYT